MYLIMKTLLFLIMLLASQVFGEEKPLFSRDLMLGSKGSDVARLQDFLEREKFLVMPPGVAKGFFGPITRDALSAWQTKNNIQGTELGKFKGKTRETITRELEPPKSRKRTRWVTFYPVEIALL